MMERRWIPRNDGGTRATLEIMRSLVLGSNQRLDGMASIPSSGLDKYLRSYWNYQPDGDDELIRTPERLFQDRVRTGKFIGDCDDAAVMAGAILWEQRKKGGRETAFSKPNRFIKDEVQSADFVAVRPPAETFFVHVFVVCWGTGGMIRIDPTAPVDADYTNWEEMHVTIF